MKLCGCHGVLPGIHVPRDTLLHMSGHSASSGSHPFSQGILDTRFHGLPHDPCTGGTRLSPPLSVQREDRWHHATWGGVCAVSVTGPETSLCLVQGEPWPMTWCVSWRAASHSSFLNMGAWHGHGTCSRHMCPQQGLML